ncbi:hypothetical protein F5H01DRAFT_332863 [Linnemannia elongata]|nr:hypothetical protein F5H01DRAFT_332863 [Linnemannia elongata]
MSLLTSPSVKLLAFLCMCVICDQNNRAFFCPQTKTHVINRKWRQRTGSMHRQHKQTHHRFFWVAKNNNQQQLPIDLGCIL